MALLYLQRPLRFDPGQHGHDLVIAQHAVVDRHGGAIVRLVDELGKAMLGDGKKLRIRMVPGVAAGIVRRRRKQAIRSAITPVGLAFALGAGIAGLGGVALSQISNVGPDMGQGYIVDSFMVVVVGGVGQLAGAVWAALGLGIFSKLLEGWAGAVIAKITILVCIIVFIQKRPQGIFALKGRFVE